MSKEEQNEKIVKTLGVMTWLLGELDELEDLPWFTQGVKQSGNRFKKELEKKLNQFGSGIDNEAKEQYVLLAEGVNHALNEALIIK